MSVYSFSFKLFRFLYIHVRNNIFISYVHRSNILSKSFAITIVILTFFVIFLFINLDVLTINKAFCFIFF